MAVAERDTEVCVFASSFFLTVSVEKVPDGGSGDELHFHPGGQGFWVARMVGHLGARAAMVAAVGGESGDVLKGLTPAWGVRLEAVTIGDDSPAYVHDRRSGEREEIARSAMPALNRHETDDLYGRVLEVATPAEVCVVTGRFPGDRLPLGFYERLGSDLRSVGVPAVGDLHGAELEAFLKGGPLHTLKVSDEEIVADGGLPADAAEAERIDAMRAWQRRGAVRVVLSSAEGPTILIEGERAFRASVPRLKAADHRGSGDSMTAALAHAAWRGLDAPQTLRLACAAGAANATRHGLGNAATELVLSLSERVEVTEI